MVWKSSERPTCFCPPTFPATRSKIAVSGPYTYTTKIDCFSDSKSQLTSHRSRWMPGGRGRARGRTCVPISRPQARGRASSLKAAAARCQREVQSTRMLAQASKRMDGLPNVTSHICSAARTNCDATTGSQPLVRVSFHIIRNENI